MKTSASKITSVSLPTDLTDRIDQVARDSERSRSYVVRKLLEQSLSATDRAAALSAIAAQGLSEYAENAKRERPRNPAEIVAAASVDGQRMLDAHQAIARGAK